MFDLNLGAAHHEIGYLLEVELEYPAHLHEKPNDYSLTVKKCSVKKDNLLEYALFLVEKFGINFNNEPKLIPNFRKKKKYGVHYRNLKYYIVKGMRLSAIHRILQFSQKPWMAKYIEFNTLRRRYAKSAFEKDFWELMHNSVFGW